MKSSGGIAPSWVIIQGLGTVLIAFFLIVSDDRDPWVWAGYGVSAAAWLVFVATLGRRPRLAVPMLVVSTATAAALAGPAAGLTATIITLLTIGRFAGLTIAGGRLIAAVVGLDLVLVIGSCLLWDRPAWDVGGASAAVLVSALCGLNRRQTDLRVRQTEQLLEQTRLAHAEHARAAALDERTRIAREIHDVLAHSLGALGVQLELAEALLAERDDRDAALTTIRRSRRLAVDGLGEAREAVAALRQDLPSLPEAVARLVEVHRRDRGPVDLDLCGEVVAVPTVATVALTAVAREALTNAAKHAPGARVEVLLRSGDQGVRLEVANGLPPGPGRGKGFGLTGMRERLELAGGTLNAGPDGGERWLVTAEVRR
ncbi:sensor histidine kinase [Amycolatopsis sp. 195334CR]|uniref:sensor histidine kinase n=1 Tax=Amycolatopsis sp. 195334CR TaxID=2814588 RepID=UPI001A8EC3F2|nr:histidine kinase [Amycolatopsis sp. 195334CR]MBN6036010.1 sensor histidine kinase [Amycolatopsis sp. 195334CR]